MGVTWAFMPGVAEPGGNAEGSPTCPPTMPIQLRDLQMQDSREGQWG